MNILEGNTPNNRIKKFVAGKLAHPVEGPVNGSYSSRIKFGKLHGMEFTADHWQRLSYWLGVYEPEVAKEMNHLVQPGDTAYDIGTHVGYFSLYLSKLVGKTGKVVSIEPSPDLRQLLERNMQQNNIDNVTIVPYALTDFEGQASFVPDSFGSHLGSHEDTGQMISVDCTSLDRLLQNGYPRPNFLKIDVEGEEANVLRGAEDTISRYRPLIISEVRSSNWQPIQKFMEQKSYTWRVLTKKSDIHYKLGLPNVLFIPCH